MGDVVGRAVGRGVGRGVGASGVPVGTGELDGGAIGVDGGPPATIGPSVGTSDGCGPTDPLGDPLAPGSMVGFKLDVALGGLVDGPVGVGVG